MTTQIALSVNFLFLQLADYQLSNFWNLKSVNPAIFNYLIIKYLISKNWKVETLCKPCKLFDLFLGDRMAM